MATESARDPDDPFDCVVVGGGPAGLSAAVQLGRLRRSVLIVDDDAGRSLWSQVTRNHLGFPDGVSAADLRLLGQRQAVRYDAELRSGRVTGLRRARTADGGFVVTVSARSVADTAAEDEELPGTAHNREREHRAGRQLGERLTKRPTEIRARTVLLGTGVVDEFPAFVGRDLCVGISLFWCIVCDGYEAIGKRVAVVGDDEDAVSTALGLRRFTDEVVLVTGRRPRTPAARLAQVEGRGIVVHRDPVAEYRHQNGQIECLVLGPRDARVRTDTSRRDDRGNVRVDCDMVFVSAPRQPRVRLATRLGATVDALGYLVVDGAGRTSVRGVYAAGDVTAGHAHQVIAAADGGAIAATAVNWDLYDNVERGG